MTTSHQHTATGDDPVVIVIPVFNDWESAALLVKALDGCLTDTRVCVLMVDDGSTLGVESVGPLDLSRIDRVDVLELRKNLGHQRAIAVGLAYVDRSVGCRAVVVMDGDGEDAPADVPRLLATLDEQPVPSAVFAERTKRSETRTFQTGYAVYRLLHRWLTGVPVRFGNFSAMSRASVNRLVLSSDLWNHYAAATVRARIPLVTIPTERAHRLAGRSHMNIVELVAHGFGAMAVFGDRVAVRMLVAITGFVTALVTAVAVLGIVQASGGWDILRGGPVIWTVAVLAIVQLLTLLLVFAFVVLGGRDRSSFIPARDASIFVHRVVEWGVRR